MSASPTIITSTEQFKSLLKSSRIVVADFYADWCGPCKAIAPVYEALSESLSLPNAVTFTKINSDNQKELAQEYTITALPTFLVFRDGKVIERVQGADPRKLQGVIQKLAHEVEAVASSSSGSGPWKGAEIPRGYGDITDQIEVRGCELLNADEDFGPVKGLFADTKPSALDKGKANAATKDWVQSGADDQLLLYIPLQGIVKLHTLQITSLPPQDDNDDEAPMRPGTIHLYINRPHNLDFSEADDTEPTQAIELSADDWNANGTANISLRYVKFQKTSSLVIYVQKGDGDGETVRLDRVKLIGEAGSKREMGQLQKVGEDE
ncbi:thioredoxin [Dactylonectria macrodidyma]|uniref:Thioredoxin n=1 Tax=Dactylonectria macrodidyma TaxID=307937 RepID=A0A9P9FRT4_9HYPO|nr:thioredoxin [Dactylonectria macrodidyma]